MPNQIFKYIYFTLGLTIVILTAIGLILFSTGLEKEENLLNSLIIFTPLILSGGLVVVTSLLLFWNEKERLRQASSLNKTNLWVLSIIFLALMLIGLISYFARYKVFGEITVLFFSVILYPSLIALLALGNNRLQLLLSSQQTAQETGVSRRSWVSVILVLVVFLALFLLFNLLFPSILFGGDVGMEGWAVGVLLGVSVLFLAPVILVLSAVGIKKD